MAASPHRSFNLPTFSSMFTALFAAPAPQTPAAGQGLPSGRPLRVVVLGGGFGGVYAAKRLTEEAAARRVAVEVHVVNRENYMAFQPMLPEVISGSVGVADTVSPIRRVVPRAVLHMREVESVDLAHNRVTCSPGYRPKSLILEYDHLVISLGSVTDFRGMTGMAEHARPVKTLGDALALRNHVIHILEEADTEPEVEVRRKMLTFIVAGGGFSGVEVIAELHEFVRRALGSYRRISTGDCRFILIHSGDIILPEVDHELAQYAQSLLAKRGVEIMLNQRLKAAAADYAILADGTRIPTKTLVATVPSHPNPVVDALDLPKERGRILVDPTMRVKERTNVWAVGDCALVPVAGWTETAPKYAPPTAQHAIREAALCADNILAAAAGRELAAFEFAGLGSLAALGRRRGIAQFMNLKLSGLIAWSMWRTVYLMKLPGIDRKIRVGTAWFLNLFLPPDIVQLRVGKSSGVSQAHFEPGQNVFEEGDLGDRVYIIIKGTAEVVRSTNGSGEQRLATLGSGQYFGEMALLNRAPRNATVRCVEGLDLLSIEKGDFNALITHLGEMRESFERTATSRGRTQ
ncbi:MAG TPA: FAD-dependent oxidoreductase [Spirochaetia bacterium]|nr:FAD-dependent oxidoreductase [Spirochaetia bacterium]